MSSAAGAGMEAECPRCKHRHGPNNKCKSCGHFGRGIIYPGPHDPHPPAAAFRLVAFDSKTQPEEESTGFLRLAQLLRNIVLIGELKMVAGQESKAASGRRTEIKEMDEHEGVSRHILGLCELCEQTIASRAEFSSLVRFSTFLLLLLLLLLFCCCRWRRACFVRAVASDEDSGRRRACSGRGRRQRHGRH